jgi:molecular chaperone HtpG
VVDSDDLPLNVSREILQQNRLIETIRSGCVRRVLELLQSLATSEPARYAEFWKEFGRVLKEGVMDMPDRNAELGALLRFASTHGAADAQDASLKDYVGRMREGRNRSGISRRIPFPPRAAVPTSKCSADRASKCCCSRIRSTSGS